jgi:hypothetical protein
MGEREEDIVQYTTDKFTRNEINFLSFFSRANAWDEFSHGHGCGAWRRI